jgi:hypothetical protein
MTTTIKTILESIEAARRAGDLSNDAARAASVALELTGDDAMLACRIIAQGADPASIQYAAGGTVDDHIALAHRQGPGSLTGQEREDWLYLASLSIDESHGSTLRERLAGLADASFRYQSATPEERAAGAEAKRAEIASLPYRVATVGGREMRVYSSDLGFAAAYWDGEPCAAVEGDYNGERYAAVGSNGTPLADLGVTVDKPLSPCFGILEKPESLGF